MRNGEDVGPGHDSKDADAPHPMEKWGLQDPKVGQSLADFRLRVVGLGAPDPALTLLLG